MQLDTGHFNYSGSAEGHFRCSNIKENLITFFYVVHVGGITFNAPEALNRAEAENVL